MAAPLAKSSRARSALFRISSFLCLLLCLSACAKRETSVEEGLRTQTLRVGNSSEPADLDPHVVLATTDQNILMALFEGLTAFEEKTGQGVPAAAEGWEISPDGLTWTFHLRAGLVWSNGDPLLADDFVQSFRRALTPAVACPYAYFFSPVRNADAFRTGKLTDPTALGFSAPDPRTVVITLAQPTPTLPMLAALPCWQPINPRVLARFDALRKRGPAWTRPGNLVGNGPFRLAEWRPNARIVVTRNPRYWDAARTRLERIEFFPIESEVEERNFRAGQLHVTYALPVSKAASYRRDAPDRLRNDPFLQVTYVQFNCRQPPFDNVKLRRALALAVDREAIVRAVYHDTARPATSLTPPGCGNYGAPVGVAFDVAAARRLLAEAGFPGGRGLPAFPVQIFNDSTASRLGEALQAMWRKELGVQTTLELLEQRTLLHNQQAKAYTAVLAGWIGDLADPISFLGFSASDSENNFTGWSNPEYDRLLREASQAGSLTARGKLFQQAEALLLAEVPVAPLVNRGKVYLIHPALKGWEPAPLGLRRYQHLRLEQ